MHSNRLESRAENCETASAPQPAQSLYAEYAQAMPAVRAGQIASSFGGFIATCAAMYFITGFSY